MGSIGKRSRPPIFPGGADDLEALTAYGAYRRSHAADKRTSEGPARMNVESGR